MRMIWHGTRTKAFRNVLNSIRKTSVFSARYFSRHRPRSGNSNANQALNVQAIEAITMYAQLLTKSPLGIRMACTPFRSCSIRFSWLHRPLANRTRDSAGVDLSWVMVKK